MKYNTDAAATAVSVAFGLGIALVAAAGITLIRNKRKREISRIPDYDMPAAPDTTRQHVRPEVEPVPVFPDSHTVRPCGEVPDINRVTEREDAAQLGLELGDAHNAD